MMKPIAVHIRLHKNARTIPVTRAKIAARSDGVSILAARYHVGEDSGRKFE